MTLVSRLIRLGCVFAVAIAIAAVLAPAPAQAQIDAGFCVYRRTVYPTPTSPSFEFTVANCNQPPGPEWTELDHGLTFAEADAERSALSAANAPTVFCVYVRAINIVPNLPSREFTVIRCDQTLGAEWGPVPGAQNLTFAAASAVRDGLNSAEAPAVWCVYRRETNTPHFTVARCDVPVAPEWRKVDGPLTFAAAAAERDAGNAASAEAVWCVFRRIVFGPDRRPVVEFVVARCDDRPVDGIQVDGPVTFPDAMAERDALAAGIVPGAGACASPAGAWTWFNGMSVTFARGANSNEGTQTDSNGATGTWTQAGRTVTLVWPSYNTTDIATLSDTGLELVGSYGLPRDTARPSLGSTTQSTSTRPSC
jgi:hypothetical protein